MRLRVIAAGTRMPDWVTAGWTQYARRLSGQCRLELLEIPLASRRGGVAGAVAAATEGERMLAAVGSGHRVVALDVAGRLRDTDGLAGDLAAWLRDGRDVDLLIGGPDGLAPAALERAGQRWSLSPLTLPHGLTRIVVAEQIYRAWTILQGHPYHRR